MTMPTIQGTTATEDTARTGNPVVVGLGIAAGGLTAAADLLRVGPAVPEPGDRPLPDPAAFDPAPLIGGRGLRYKDRATRLALLAATYALEQAGLSGVEPDEATGVVVSSNFGNLDTVCRVARVIRAEGVRGTSPMDLPNASSNVIASSVAIKFGLRGPNLMVCNGATSGLDAMYWASVLIGSGRVRRVLAIGVETSNPTVGELVGTMFDGAAALVLETAESARDRGIEALATVGGYARRADAARAADAALRADGGPAGIGLLLADAGQAPPPGAGQADGRDLEALVGPCSGALGALQCLAAVAWLRAEGRGAALAVAGADADDGSAALVLRAAGGPR